MSLNFYQGETTSQTVSMNAVCNRLIDSMQKTIASITLFNLTMNLRGRAYSSAKNYMMEVYVPLARGIISLCEELISQNSKYPSDFRAQVTSANVVESDIIDQIEHLNTLIRNIETASAENLLVSPILFIYRKMKQRLEKILADLHTFEGSSSENYATAIQFATQISIGLTQIQNNGFNSLTGTFSTAGIDLGWAQELETLHYTRLAYEKYGEYLESNEADIEKVIAVIKYEERNRSDAERTSAFLENSDLEERDIIEIKYLMYTAEEPYRGVAMMYLDRFSIGGIASSAFFRPSENKIYLDVESDRNNSRGNYYTFFHEVMHAADYYHGIEQGYDGYFSDHFTIEGENLNYYMYQDARNHFTGELSKELQASQYDHLSAAEKQQMITNVTENLMLQDDLYAELSPEEQQLSLTIRAHYEQLLHGPAHNTASDVYGGITNFTVRGNYGHQNADGTISDYWFVDGIGGADGERNREPNREGIAEYYGRLMTEDNQTRTDGLDSIDEFLPTSRESMDIILEEMRD